MLTYHPLTLVRREAIAEDAVLLELSAPAPLAEVFRFQGGQHLPLRAFVNGEDLRRTYSIVSAPGGALTLGVRVQGAMSRHLAALKVGDTIDGREQRVGRRFAEQLLEPTIGHREVHRAVAGEASAQQLGGTDRKSVV